VLPIERLRGWYHTSDITLRRDDGYLVYGHTAGPELALAVFRFSREKLAPYKRSADCNSANSPRRHRARSGGWNVAVAIWRARRRSPRVCRTSIGKKTFPTRA